MRTDAKSYAALLAIATCGAHAAETTPALLPDGPGRDQLMQACSACHPIERVVAERRSAEQWDDLIARMVGLGAQANDEEQQRIFEYLVQFFSASGS